MKLTTKQLERACGRCVHFKGMMVSDCCAVGVFNAAFNGSLPCLKHFDKGLHTCESRRYVTPEEAQAEEDEHEAWSLRVNAALPIVAACKQITATGGATSFSHVCPICGAELRIRISPGNLHAKVSCITPNCILWIE